MMIHEIIRKAIPSASDGLCEYIIWGRTPFPFKSLSAKDFYRAADRYRRATEKSFELCDHCDRIAIPKRFICERCESALIRHRSTVK